MPSRLRLPAAISLLAAATLAVAPAPLCAQLPGGALRPADMHAAQFRHSMVSEVVRFMRSWERSWHQPDILSARDHYTRDAVILQPSGAFVKGRDAVRDFTAAFDGITAEARTTLLDFDASDGVSYFYGPFSFVARSPAVGEITGRKVTILLRDGADWRIRAQFFVTPDSSFGPAHGTMFPAPFEFAGSNGDDQAAYGLITLLMQSLRQQWSTGDGGGGRGLAADDLLLQLPGELSPLRNDAALQALEQQRGTLHTGVADFHRRGRMSYMMGPYYLQRDGPSRAGRYMAVFMSYDGVWLLRSLIFT